MMVLRGGMDSFLSNEYIIYLMQSITPYYIQSLGDISFIVHDVEFTEALMGAGYLQPDTLNENTDEMIPGLDYSESKPFDNISEDVVFSKNFILQKNHAKFGLLGYLKTVAAISLTGSGSRETAVTGVEFLITKIADRKRDEVILKGRYDFAEPLVNVSSTKLAPISAAINLPITSKVMKSEELYLTINVYGYVSKGGDGENKVYLIHSRGEKDSYVVLPLIVYDEDGPAAPRTVFVDYESRPVKDYEAVIEEVGVGAVHILNIKSASSAFGVSIQIDDNNELRRSYTDLNGDTDELDGLSAYYHNGYYVISVSDLKFRDKIKVGPYTTAGGSLTFERLQGKYEVIT